MGILDTKNTVFYKMSIFFFLKHEAETAGHLRGTAIKAVDTTSRIQRCRERERERGKGEG